MQAQPDGASIESERPLGAESRKASATVQFIGGRRLPVVQGPTVTNSRLEAAHEAGGKFAPLTETSGQIAFISPLAVAYVTVETPSGEPPNGQAREANTRVHFIDGTELEVTQGVRIANKRLEAARAASGLFAYLTAVSGTPVYVSRLAITHIAVDSR